VFFVDSQRCRHKSAFVDVCLKWVVEKGKWERENGAKRSKSVQNILVFRKSLFFFEKKFLFQKNVVFLCREYPPSLFVMLKSGGSFYFIISI